MCSIRAFIGGWLANPPRCVETLFFWYQLQTSVLLPSCWGDFAQYKNAIRRPLFYFVTFSKLKLMFPTNSAVDYDGSRLSDMSITTTDPYSVIADEQFDARTSAFPLANPSHMSSDLEGGTIPSTIARTDGRITSTLCKPKRHVSLLSSVLTLGNVRCSARF